MPRVKIPLIDRLMAKVSIQPNGCWHFTGFIDGCGYGRIWAGRTSSIYAHVVSYELLIGAVPDGLQLDHTCHSASGCSDGNKCLHRRCVNPQHLEPVSETENKHRIHANMGPARAVMVAMNKTRTKCRNEHDYNKANTGYDRNGHRFCVECNRIHAKHYQRRKRAERKSLIGF